MHRRWLSPPLTVAMPDNTSSFVVTAQRTRKSFQSKKRPKLTPEQRASQKARGNELEARLNGVADNMTRNIKEIAKDFNRSVPHARA